MTDTNSTESHLGALLKRARKRAGVSLRSLSAALETDHSEVCKMERGEPRSLARYTRVADLLGYTIEVKLKRR